MGRILVRGEQGHDIIHQLYPIAGEPVIDKPGKGSFHATDLQQILLDRGIKTLIVCGVTLEVCVHTTVREANDRGYECVVLSDCVASYFPEFQRVGLEMIKAQGAIFGWVSNSKNFITGDLLKPSGTIQALSVGHALDVDAAELGAVHSVFARAVNLEIRGRHVDAAGRRQGRPSVRHSRRVAGPSTLSACAAASGRCPIGVRGHRARSRRLVVDCRAAPRWMPARPGEARAGPEPAARRRRSGRVRIGPGTDPRGWLAT